MPLLQERSNTVLEASLRLGVVRMSRMNEVDRASIISITHLDFQDFEIRVRLKVNDKYYTGVLELNE